MRTDFRRFATDRSTGRIEAEAWVVLEMHFLSRPHLREEARLLLAETLASLRDAGVTNEIALKDQACRRVQVRFGPAPPLNDDALPPATQVA